MFKVILLYTTNAFLPGLIVTHVSFTYLLSPNNVQYQDDKIIYIY